MKWELYEVWSEDEDGHEALIETTKSLKEAKVIAKQVLTDGFVCAIIYRENEEGEQELVEEITS